MNYENGTAEQGWDKNSGEETIEVLGAVGYTQNFASNPVLYRWNRKGRAHVKKEGLYQSYQ